MEPTERYLSPPPCMSPPALVPCGIASGGRILCECQCYAAGLVNESSVELISPTSRDSPAEIREAGGHRGAGGRGDGGEDDVSCVLYQEEEGIATLTLNRPKSKHAFNAALFLRLAQLLERAERSESVLAVVITGSGGYFTSGADIKELQQQSISPVPMIQQPFGVFGSAVLRFPKLLVAAVNGPAVGVGVTLLPHCDLVYAYGGRPRTTSKASREGDVGRRRHRGIPPARQEREVGVKEGATLWTPFFQLAIVPEFCSSLTFPETLGLARANDMLVMGRKLSAQEALSSGMVSTVVTADTEKDFLIQASGPVKHSVRRKVVDSCFAAESVRTFKRMMWRDRRPRMIRVFAEECGELDKRMQAGHPKAALKHLTKDPPARRSKL
ncbi:unnamed protein product [Ectocarpus fasciculatus]